MALVTPSLPYSLQFVPTVSVIVPAFNRAETIATSLDSLIAQTYEDWEAIIVDDGSTDTTAEVVQGYAAVDPRIRLFQQENAGVSAARNAGIDKATGRWIFFLDADDWIVPDTLTLLLGAVAHDPDRTIAIGRSVLVLPDGEQLVEAPPPPSEQMFSEFARRCVYTIHTSIQPTELVRAVGGFDSSLTVCEDWDLWQRIARTRPTYVYIPEKIAYYRIRAASASRSALQLLVDGATVIHRGHHEDPRLADWPGRLYPPPDPSQTPAAILYTAAYCAGLAIGVGEDPLYLLDHLPEVGRHDAEGRWIADTLFHSIAVGFLKPVTAWPTFPPEAQQRAVSFAAGLAEKSNDAVLARTTGRAFEALVARQMLQVSGGAGTTIGTTHVVRVPVGTEIHSADIPSYADRTMVELVDERDPDPTDPEEPIAVAMLPATDGVFAAAVAVDALAEEAAWDLLEDLLEETVFASLDVVYAEDELVVRRGRIELGRIAYDDEQGTSELIHQAAGWVLFLQELWGLPELPSEAFYEPAVVPGDSDAPQILAHDDRPVPVEITAQLPLIRSEGDRVLVEVSLAGLPMMALRIPTVDGTVSPHRLRRAINIEGKFELCLVSVREAIFQGEWPRGTPVRVRLQALAARRERAVAANGAAGVHLPEARRLALIEEMVPPGHHVVLLGRRRTRMFPGSACRLEVLPYESRELFTASAMSSGQLILEHGDPDLPKMAMYLPYLFDPAQVAIGTLTSSVSTRRHWR